MKRWFFSIENVYYQTILFYFHFILVVTKTTLYPCLFLLFPFFLFNCNVMVAMHKLRSIYYIICFIWCHNRPAVITTVGSASVSLFDLVDNMFWWSDHLGRWLIWLPISTSDPCSFLYSLLDILNQTKARSFNEWAFFFVQDFFTSSEESVAKEENRQNQGKISMLIIHGIRLFQQDDDDFTFQLLFCVN